MLYKLLLIFIASGLVAANTTITSAQPSAPSTIQATPQVAAQAAVQPVVTETTGTSATITTPKTAINFEQAKNDIIRNIRHQYAILHTLTNEFKAIWRNETAYAEGVYKNITDNLNYYITDPDDKETAELDASLSSFYPFGGKESDYIDTIEKMNEYCSKLDSRLEALKSWIRRKYRYNMIVQVSFNLILGKINEKNDYFCNSTAHKEDYIKNMKKVKENSAKLAPLKEKLLDTTVFIQNSTYQLPKIGRLCCSFWEFYRGLKNEVKSGQGVDFVVDITFDYFAGASKYICFLYPYGSELCKDEEKAPKMVHKHQSIVLETLLTLGEIATP